MSKDADALTLQFPAGQGQSQFLNFCRLSLQPMGFEKVFLLFVYPSLSFHLFIIYVYLPISPFSGSIYPFFVSWSAYPFVVNQLQSCTPVTLLNFFFIITGIRGEVKVIVKVDYFIDSNKFRQSSCGVQFFYSK